MKLLKLDKINKTIKKYSSIILSSILILTKKDKVSSILLYLIISVIGFLFFNNDENNENNENNDNKKSKDWKSFITKQLNRNAGSNDGRSDRNNDGSYNEDNDGSYNEDNDRNYNEDNDRNYNEDNDRNYNEDNDDIYNEDNDDIYNEENDNKNDSKNNIINEPIKKIIIPKKRMNKIIDKNLDNKAYPNKISKLSNEYNKSDDNIFKLKVNNNNKNIPLFNLRSSDNIDFYWNFHLHNAGNSKINSLILCRDIHQWMNNSSLSDEDLEDQCYPIYIILKDHKTDNEIMIFEAYKIFVYPNENGNKHAFITKGDNYKTIEEILNILIEKKYIHDLLNTKEYESYNLTSHDSVCLFLNNLLSHFLPSESQEGEVIKIDLDQYNENKNTFDYFYHTNNMDSDLFNTNI